MKKLFKMLLSISLFLIIPTPIKAIQIDEDIPVDTVNFVVSKIENYENVDLKLDSTKVLYDVELNPSYLFLKFDNGYAIVSKEHGIIAEYCLDTESIPYSESTNGDILVYAGPLNYVILPNTKTALMSANNPLSNVSPELIEKNKEFLSIEGSTVTPLATTSSSYIGLPSSQFTKYYKGKWHNSTTNYPPSQGYPSNGLCGTLAVSALLAYYDDYINNNIVPTPMRAQGSESPGTLITTVFKYIDKLHMNGTIPENLYTGINTFLDSHASSVASSYRPVFYNLSTLNKAKEIIGTKQRPMCIGLTKLAGYSSNHWVLAYAYQINPSADDLYKCVNNAGSSGASYNYNVHVSWTCGYVYLKG